MQYSEFFPPLRWARRVSINSIKSDAFAGFTNAAIVLPQGVAFATIAGLPPQYGLYTAMITAVVAALFGSSMIMISGPTTAISAVLFATLSGFEEAGTARYIELALMMTILVGLFQILAGVGRLGGLVSFVSHSVITAFTASAALLIAVSQIAGALGVHVERGGNVVERLWRVGEHFVDVNGYAVLIAIVSLASAILVQRFAPKLPGFMIGLLVGSGLAYGIDASAHGVAMVGALPSALPEFAPPTGAIRDVVLLAPGALAIALVGLLEAISIGRAFAVRRGEEFDANQEMIGQGLSNAVGGFFQCYAGSGSFTRSGVNAAAGAVTPLSGIFASAFLALTLLFVSPLVAYIPTPAMAGLILLVAWKLIDFHELKHIVTTSRPETVILFLTLGSGLLIELDFAIYVGVIASLSVFVFDAAHPEVTVTLPSQSNEGVRKFREYQGHNKYECPQAAVITVSGTMYFGSVENVERTIARLRKERPHQRSLVLILKSARKIDLASADMLIKLSRDIQSKGGRLDLVVGNSIPMRSLERLHVIEELGEDCVHRSKLKAIAAATAAFDKRVCKGCLLDVFNECDRNRDG